MILLASGEIGFPDNEEVNLDDFFTEAEESKKEEKETDTITCPYCHKQFIKEQGHEDIHSWYVFT